MTAHYYEQTDYRTPRRTQLFANRTAAEAILFGYGDEPEKFHLPLFRPLHDETIGRELYRHFLPLLHESSLLREAWITINQTTHYEIATEARKLLSVFQEIFSMFRDFDIDLGHLPPLHAFNTDDESLLIEWIFRDFRVGFTLEVKQEESGWYLVSNKNLGEISASGYISNIDVKKLVLWLFNFVLTNA